MKPTGFTRISWFVYRLWTGQCDPVPQHAYRQTERGRVARLSPAMRARQRELRVRGGRR